MSSDAHWGKAKYDYYYTDYVDQDYPSKLAPKEERLAIIEQEEALRIQKKLLSTIDSVDISSTVYEEGHGEDGNDVTDDLIAEIEHQNRSIEETQKQKLAQAKRKVVSFDEDTEIKSCDDTDDGQIRTDERRRRPINIAIQKNRGLTPYKKKEYRNPRVKHKLKYKRAMSKRRRNVKEAQLELSRYSGEAAGIKTSTIKSIKLS